jgi:N-acylneuraminate cytidylyltransferase
MSYYAFIPLRSGSKKIKDKNIKIINGHPLYHYAIEAAQQTKDIDKILIATDSERYKQEIQGHCKQYKFDKVVFVDRPKELSQDNSQIEECLVKGFLSFMAQQADVRLSDNIVLIQATNPFIKSEYLTKGIELHKKRKYGSVISAVKSHQFIWDTGYKSNYTIDKRPNRQNWSGYYIENGSFYINKFIAIMYENSRITLPAAFLEMPKESLFEIDSEEDIKIVEKLL